MKKLMAWALLLAMLLPLGAQAQDEALPQAFRVKYKVEERKINKERSFVSKEHVTTARKDVDQVINGLVDAFDAEYAPQLVPDKTNKPRRNSRLDIHVVHSVSGESAVSFLVLARDTCNRRQRWSPFTTRVFDMADGRLITLADLFPADSAAWQVLGNAVREQLAAYFPAEDADQAVLSALCTPDALRQAEFMLGPVCLSLHYEARILYPDHPTLMQVRVPYSALRGMMTEYGERQTDNSRYKMVALTFDDGPSYTTTALVLNHLRHAGAQATFFLIGDRINEYPDIAMRENDENHSLQSHTFKHVDASKQSQAKLLSNLKSFEDALIDAVGMKPTMLRAPYGVFDPFVEADIGLGLIHWGVDTKDWTGKSSSGVLNVVKDEVRSGSIVLMHDIKENTPESTQKVTEWLFSKGYLCVTVQDLFLHFEKEMIPNKIYYAVNENTNTN